MVDDKEAACIQLCDRPILIAAVPDLVHFLEQKQNQRDSTLGM